MTGCSHDRRDQETEEIEEIEDRSTPSQMMDMEAPMQEPGDPEVGYQLLVNSGYVNCGIPEKMSSLIPVGDESNRISGRNDLNQDMPYFLTKYEAPSGVNLIVANCLACHASHFNGELIVGLGDIYQDYTQDLSQTAELGLRLADRLLDTQAEIDELTKFVNRTLAIADYSQTLTVGVNPAVSITAGIMAHLDPETLTWSETPTLDVPQWYRDFISASNPPPWWWYKKKSRMFYSASGGGSHVAWSMLASSMCLDNKEQAQKIADTFPDILAYIKTIPSPEYPWDIDPDLADRGEEVFGETCSACHGTYGLQWTYPEVLVPIDQVGVDAEMAVRMYEADLFHDWIDRSFFGESSRATPELGYIAPPLDGVWATAPYLHNGSVPTIETLLNSSKRPTCWTWSYDSTDYNQATLGWNFQESECHDQISSASERSLVYDSTQYSYGNQGHTYGDALSVEDRTALLEYLKTL